MGNDGISKTIQFNKFRFRLSKNSNASSWVLMLQVILRPNTKSLLEALLLLGVTPVSSHVALSDALAASSPPASLWDKHRHGPLPCLSSTAQSPEVTVSRLSALHSRCSPLPHKGAPSWPPPLLSESQIQLPDHSGGR